MMGQQSQTEIESHNHIYGYKNKVAAFWLKLKAQIYPYYIQYNYTKQRIQCTVYYTFIQVIKPRIRSLQCPMWSKGYLMKR